MTVESIKSILTKPVINGKSRKYVYTGLVIISTVVASVFLLGGKYQYVMAAADDVPQVKRDIHDIKLDVREINVGMEMLLKAHNLK